VFNVKKLFSSPLQNRNGLLLMVLILQNDVRIAKERDSKYPSQREHE
jgi:hypothetical protein